MFRGYLAQGIGVLTKNRLLVVIFPAIIFGLVHSFNPEVEEFGFWLVMPQYVLFGLIFGLISILDDGIELAMGAHTINNVFLSLFITHKASAIQTNALFVQENLNAPKDLIIMFVIGTIFVTTLTMIYKFKFSLLTKKITPPDTGN